MAYTRAAFTLKLNGQTLVFTAASETGTAVTVYSSADESSAVTLPATLTADTTYYVDLGGRGTRNLLLTLAQPDGTDLSRSISVADAAVPLIVEPVPSAKQLAADVSTLGGTLVAWQPNTAYTQGQAVTYLGVIYLAKASFTSGSSFVAGNWDTVVPSSSGATVTELVASGLLINSNAIVAATDSFPFFIAPFACKITQVSLASKNGVAASDTNYWEVRLRKSNAGGPNTIASKYTKVTGGAALVANVDWNFDAISFDPTAQTFAKGDMFNVAFFLTGSSTGITWSYVACTIRYEPI